MEFASADLIVRLHATATLMFASELEEALRAFIRKRDVARTHNLKEGSHKNRKDPLAMLIEKTFRALLKERNGVSRKPGGPRSAARF